MVFLDNIDTISINFQWWILRLSAIHKKSLTDSLNNIGSRDASASKNQLQVRHC